MNILQALDDPNLFARHFRAEPWRRWRVFLAALFGLPMDDEQLAIYRQHTARTTPPTEPFKEAALVVGRRGGKSRMLALTATYLSTFRSYEESLAPGEVATVAVIAADRRQARVIFRYTDGLFRAVPMLAGMIDSARDEVIRLNNRVVIEIHTANFRVTRGYTFAAVLADETAFWRDKFSANPDVEIFRALLPGLGTIPSSMLLNASSPYRRAGVLYHTYRRHYGQDAGRVLVWQAPTAEMNPTIDPEIIAEAYDEDRERGGRVWRTVPRGHRRLRVPRGGRRPHTPGLVERPPSSSSNYHAFVDPAGGSGSDSMTLAISHSEGDLSVLDALREMRPPFSPEAVVEEFATLLHTYRVTTVGGRPLCGRVAPGAVPQARCRVSGVRGQQVGDLPERPAAAEQPPRRAARREAPRQAALRSGAPNGARGRRQHRPQSRRPRRRRQRSVPDRARAQIAALVPNPTPAQQILIEQAARVSAYLAVIDDAFVRGARLTPDGASVRLGFEATLASHSPRWAFARRPPTCRHEHDPVDALCAAPPAGRPPSMSAAPGRSARACWRPTARPPRRSRRGHRPAASALAPAPTPRPT